MGVFASRQNGGVEELDIAPNHAYRYPPKSGCYFGSYFIMGGERFESTQPEAYLFGENQDLNFLGARPLPFPYPAPQSNEPTKTIKSLVNIRKDSLRLVRLLEEEDRPDVTSRRLNTTGSSKDGVSLKSGVEVPSPEEDAVGPSHKTSASSSSGAKYNVEFTFDADARCAITIYYFVSENIDGHHAVYVPKDPEMSSETYRYKAGANQQFVQTTHVLEPGRFSEDDWHMVGGEKDIIPIVIQCVVEDEEDHIGHSHMTFACIEKTSDGYTIKALKQKQMVDGLCYLLQEIYGIENKKAHVDASKGNGDGDGGGGCDDDPDDNGSECVICMSDVRDTLILPCRHLCLCNGCADSLRYQANNCPICRAPFRALLQIRAMRKKTPDSMEVSPEVECPVNQEGCPAGYEAISLIEALNGPSTPTHRVVSSDGVVGDDNGELSVVHNGGGDAPATIGASAGIPQSRSSMAEVTSSGVTGQGRSSSGSHRSKRRTSSARAGSGKASGRSVLGSPRVTQDPNQTTPSTTPLLHHNASPAASVPVDQVLRPVSSATLRDPKGLMNVTAAGGCSVPRCRSVEDEGDFAIVSIPARRARIAKMGEDVESLGSAMSESPSCDAVMTRPTSASFPASSGLALEGQQIVGVASDLGNDDDKIEDDVVTPPGDRDGTTPESPTTPVAPANDVAMDVAIDNVEVIGSNARTTPVAADV